ncbi:hypothetical protein [Pseudomonas sp.]|nr:hypothetical protein [Pseudomonas sp.]
MDGINERWGRGAMRAASVPASVMRIVLRCSNSLRPPDCGR